MKATAEKLEKSKAQLTIEVPVEDFEKSMDKAYHIVVKKVNIPGFRKGKAPRRLLENIYGREALLEEALNDAVPKYYMEALEQFKEEYTAVSDPHYEIVQTEKGQPLIFKASFDTKPEVTLGQYKGLELEKVSSEVKPEDVDKEIAATQQRYAKLSVTEGPASLYDVLTIDFLGKVDGQPFSDGEGKDYPLTLGSHSFIPGFEEQLIGAQKDETKDIEVTFPQDYHAKELAGKAAVFTVNVKEIKRKELSPLDDEFAKDVSEFETLQELRQDIENKLKEAAQKEAEQELNSNAVKKAVDNASVDIPESMFENRVNRMIEDVAYRLNQQGIAFDYYLKATNSDLEAMRKTYRPNAEVQVKTDLVLEAIAKAEELKASPEDVEREIGKIAEQVKREPAEIRELMGKQGQISAMEYSIMIDKAVDLLVKEAIIS